MWQKSGRIFHFDKPESILCGGLHQWTAKTGILPAVRFSEGNASILYAGDFDPEGLLIAQRLKERYEDSLYLWKYEAEWYKKYLYGVRLSGSRIKKLDHVYRPELLEIKKWMQKEQKAAYQEAMIEIYLDQE